MNELPLQTMGLSVGFRNNVLLQDFNLSLSAGDTVAITGKSGCGKSTLLWNLLGLLSPIRGQVQIAGETITGASQRKAALLRRTKIGVVFQQPQLVSELTPVENAMVPLLMQGIDRAEAASRAEELLGALGVPTRAKVQQLSGGEQQRVSIARALVTKPCLVIADEPTAALDEVTAGGVVEQLLQHAQVSRAAVLLVTHSSLVAQQMHRTICLS